MQSIVRPLKIAAGGATHIGRTRQHNEDAILIRSDLGLYVVADGAGGHNAGNVASALAVASLANHFEGTEALAREAPSIDRFGLRTGARRLASAIHKANREVVAISGASRAHSGMGSTIVALSPDLHDTVMHLAHVGDSRCYRLRDGQFELLTHDHSLLNDVLSLKPDIPDAALAKLPRKVVTRALGMEEAVRVSIRTIDVVEGDAFVLCSDGLTGELDDIDIAGALAQDDEPNAIVSRLIRAANDAGGRDNIGVVVVRCTGIGGSTHRTPLPREIDDESTLSDLTEDSVPEILLLAHEVALPLESLGQLRAVPSDRANQHLIDVLGTLVESRQREVGPGFDRACKECGATIAGDEVFCPQCGKKG